MKIETNREIAERIAEKSHPSRSLTHNAELVANIEAALDTERERCAKIAEDGDYQCEQGNCHASIAAAIRGSKE